MITIIDNFMKNKYQLLYLKTTIWKVFSLLSDKENLYEGVYRVVGGGQGGSASPLTCEMGDSELSHFSNLKLKSEEHKKIVRPIVKPKILQLSIVWHKLSSELGWRSGLKARFKELQLQPKFLNRRLWSYFCIRPGFCRNSYLSNI